MSKMQIAIIEALASGEWMSSASIAEAAHFPAASVRVSLAGLCREGIVVKKDDPDRPQYCVYRINNVPAGFGVSQSIAAFDKCLQAVRQ
ncbi:hypothetical protein VRC35_06505 [Erwinia aphidicola]|uniref:hypothetical protein n=1 Tax=Erwinia aphidicola TaxID=68334 RepID=UPI0030D597C0